MELMKVHSRTGPVTNSSSVIFLVKAPKECKKEEPNYSGVTDLSSGKKLWAALFDYTVFDEIFGTWVDRTPPLMLSYLEGALKNLQAHPNYPSMEECVKSLRAIYDAYAKTKDSVAAYGELKADIHFWIQGQFGDWWRQNTEPLLEGLVLTHVDRDHDEEAEHWFGFEGVYYYD